MSDPRPAASTVPAGLILAGGAGRRMGGGKHAVRLGGRSLLQRAIDRLEPQVGVILLSCNEPLPGPPDGVRAVLPDPLPGLHGPLAGVLAGLEYLAARPQLGDCLLSVAVDTPWFPLDLAHRLAQARSEGSAETVVAASASGDHPVFALWSVALAGLLREWLQQQPERSVRRFQARHRTVIVRWDDGDPFHNLNTPEQLAAAERSLATRIEAD
jgi:molybdopterin-guanine dinucleotide biosynthesis protein A